MTDASKKIGEHLLKGWTLLGDNCPNGCNVPLMRSRNNKSLVCLGCDTDFLAQATEVSRASEKGSNSVNEYTKESVHADSESVLGSKFAWLIARISETESIADLHSMVDLANKLLVLRKSI
jgi:uncharacterized Zn finger protein (UPF0148 family)